MLDEHSWQFDCNRRRFLKFVILDDQKATDASSGAETSEEKLVAGVIGAVASELEVQSTSSSS